MKKNMKMIQDDDGYIGTNGYFHRTECSLDYDMEASFPYIHYSNPYWDKEHTIFGAKELGLEYQYSDRLEQFDYDKAKKARIDASKKHPKFNAAYVQEYLTQYYGKPIILRHVIGGVNRSNGYNYYVYGFKQG